MLEVLFVYTTKMSPKEHFNISSYIPSLQFITRLPDSNKGWAKGHVLVSDPWSRSIEGSDKLFQPTRSPEIPSIKRFHDLFPFYTYVFVATLISALSTQAKRYQATWFSGWRSRHSSILTSCSTLTKLNRSITSCL